MKRLHVAAEALPEPTASSVTTAWGRRVESLAAARRTTSGLTHKQKQVTEIFSTRRFFNDLQKATPRLSRKVFSMRIGISAARTQLHSLLKRCSTGERIILTRRGVPVCWLQPFPRTQRQSDLELLRKIAEFVPYEIGGLVLDKEKEPNGR
jgi:antitoxin (DNA-binding transcriptional repressor) of toxin-antitoxin stability system